MNRYYFSADWRKRWGDSYDTFEIVVKAKNIQSAEEKAYSIYKDITKGEWEGSARDLIKLTKAEDFEELED